MTAITPAAPHILVIDDDQRLRQLLARFLGDRGFLVSQAGSTAEARTLLSSLIFDLMVVDVMMPAETGIEFLADLRRHQSVSTPALMLTALGETRDRIRGLEAGADDYLMKPFEPQELLLRINAILRRVQTASDPSRDPHHFGGLNFNAKRGELMRGDESIPLTAGEAALLRLFVRRAGVTLSRADVAREAGLPESRAIDVQITRLRRKIEADPRNPRHLQTVWGQGYVFWLDG